MRRYSVRLSAPYEFIVQKAINKTDYKNFSQVVRWGLDLIKKELKLKIDTDDMDLEFKEPVKRDGEEWTLAGKLSTEQLSEYQIEYEPKGISIREYGRIKELDIF